jgi:hypothetical protein
MLDSVFFAKSTSQIQTFLGGPWGVSLYLVASMLLMFLCFKLMKFLDNSMSYQKTYHPPRS